MTLYGQTKMTELEHETTVQKALPAKIGIRNGSPIVCWSATKI